VLELGNVGKVIHRSKDKDLALVQLQKLPADAKALKLAKDGVGPGDDVHSLGNPGVSGALWVYTPGNVRAVYQKKFTSTGRDGGDPLSVDAKVVETTSPVNPGDSGGPVVNSRGELVAVTQGGIFDPNARAISIFIDVSEVRTILNDLVKKKKI